MNAEVLIRSLIKKGISTFCVCAGARNAELLLKLANLQNEISEINVLHFFDERSAAFFALGMIQKNKIPVAVVTTSGTAVCECLPAVTEAFYSNLPLVVLSADRPRSFRFTGSPQTINQIGVFKNFIEFESDIESADDLNNALDQLNHWKIEKPIHINICLSDPLRKEIRDNSDKKTNNDELKPVIILSGLSSENRKLALSMVNKIMAPVYVEATSGLSQFIKSEKRICGGEKSIQALFEKNICNSVIRIGNVPTLSFWRDLESKWKNIPVFSISEIDFSGLSRESVHMNSFLKEQEFLKIIENVNTNMEAVKALDSKLTTKKLELLQKYKNSEPAWIKRIAQKAHGLNLYIGNSMPIRNLDFILENAISFQDIQASRGVNGIDGQIATFLGGALASGNSECWCVVGDLTALYDLNAFWAAQFIENKKLRVVVINNNGGQIFKNKFDHNYFINKHNLDFKIWAQMWGWDYCKLDKYTDLIPENSDRLIVEVVPDSIETQSLSREWQLNE
jgi:2-succinyl-5-enolpyruvyl-6-hydroxy-3-cyclohexene-1-carboxylate synthase